MDQLLKNFPLSTVTTLKIGGPAKYFIEVTSTEQLVKLLSECLALNLKFYILGEGSNIVASDTGFNGLIIKNSIKKLEIYNNKEAVVGAGNNLLDFIYALDAYGMAGMEKMAGIPGTVAGAIYGNAGAYGQETKDHIESVTFLDLSLNDQNNNSLTRTLPSSDLHLAYRTSIFQSHREWIIVEAKFSFEPDDPHKLLQISDEIIEKRKVRYPPGMKCPGSFFKNIVLDKLPSDQKEHLLSLIPSDGVQYGKVTAGYLLEQIGAKGMRKGAIVVAGYHGNLFFNEGKGTASDIKDLADELRQKVKEKFGITLEEEVQYLS